MDIELPQSKEMLETAGKPVEGACLIDLRSQRLKLTKDEKIDNLTHEYEPRFSTGIWFFGETASRFHNSYKEHLPIKQRLEYANEMGKFGLRAVEAHFGEDWEINKDTISFFRELRQEAGIVISLIGGAGGDFRKKDAMFGTLSNRDENLRRKFIQQTIDILKFAKTLSKEQGYPPVANIWPGTDGFVCALGTDFHDMWERFESGVAEAMDEVPGVRVTIEPKPYEPVVNSIYRHTADGLLFCKDVENKLKNPVNTKLLKQGHVLMAMNPEIGHMSMGQEEVASTYARVMREGRLAHVHVNSVPLGSYDQDLNAGVAGMETLEAVLFVLRMYGYKGFMGMDLNPEYMDVRAALANSFNEIHRANAVVDGL
ncbi:MAG: TIM barrel protein, partial [Candidatus Aenigmatarchaeota archaeon]